MKLATSTNIMDADCDRPYRIPVDVSARACARAGYQYVDACLCSYCREGQPLRGEYWEKWIEETVALKEELNIQFPRRTRTGRSGKAFSRTEPAVTANWGKNLCGAVFLQRKHWA